MTCSSYCKNIVETHSDISNDDRLYGCPECCPSFFSFFYMFVSSDFPVELPYYVEEEDGSEELETRDLHEPDNSEGENNTENSGTSHSPKNRLFPIESC